MQGIRFLRLDTPLQTSGQILKRWRWWLAIGCGVAGIAIEWLEHNLEMHVDAIEIVGYGLVLPLLIWWLLTHLAVVLADRAGAVASHARQQAILDQLDKHRGWQELIGFVVRLPGSVLPVSRTRLYIYDHRTGQFQLTADSTRLDVTAAQTSDQAMCKACVLTRQPHYQAGFTEYCQPLVYDNLLIGVLRLKFRADAFIEQSQLQFLDTLAPRLALALAMSIARPQRIMQAQAEARHDERRQVAYELHDSLAQHLSYLHLSLDRLSAEAGQLPDEALHQELGGLREIAGEAYHQVRDALGMLRSRQHADLTQALRHYTQLVSQRTRLRVTLVTHGEPVKLPDTLQAGVFSLVRESLNNVQRHARAYEAQVVLFWGEDQLIVAVTDDGVGFNPAMRPAPGHHGPSMLHERVASLNGQLHIHSTPDRGTRLFFYLPLDHVSMTVATPPQLFVS